jgi:hypothetical protein
VDELDALQKMKSLLPILVLAMLSIVGCKKDKNEVSATVASSDQHRKAVAKFQGAQKRFKELIATVRDEKSFDAAKPELDKIVSDWREVSATLSQFQPPEDKKQAEMRDLIADGHRRTEPTGEDMLSLISIESREAEVTKWLEEFAEAGGKAMLEMVRLYGPTEYALESAKADGIDLGNGAVLAEGALFEAMKRAEQVTGQPAARSESDSEGSDKHQPEAEGRSR